MATTRPPPPPPPPLCAPYASGGPVPDTGDSVPVVIAPASYSLDGGKTGHDTEEFLKRILAARSKR